MRDEPRYIKGRGRPVRPVGDSRAGGYATYETSRVEQTETGGHTYIAVAFIRTTQNI